MSSASSSQWTRWHLLRGAGLLSGLTLAGKVVTWGRESVAASAFGATSTMDQLVLSSTVAVSITGFVAGVVALGIPPIVAGAGRQSESRKTETVLSLLVIILAFLILVGVVLLFAGRPILSRMAPDWTPQEIAICVGYLRGYYLAGGLSAIAALIAAYLVCEGEFLTPGLLTALTGLGAILVVRLGSADLGGTALVWGAIADGVIGLAVTLIGVRRLGISLRGRMRMNSDARIGAAVWRSAALVYLFMNVAVLVSRSVASGLSEGSMALLGWADKLAVLPMSVLILPLAQVIYAASSTHRDTNQSPSVPTESTVVLMGVLELSAVITPLAVVLAPAIVDVLLGYGRMTAGALDSLGQVTRVFLVALPALSLSTIGSRMLYAHGRSGVVVLAFASGFSVQTLLIYPLAREAGLLGIVWASTIGSYVAASLMMRALQKSGSVPPGTGNRLAKAALIGGLGSAAALLILARSPLLALAVGLIVVVSAGAALGLPTVVYTTRALGSWIRTRYQARG